MNTKVKFTIIFLLAFLIVPICEAAINKSSKNKHFKSVIRYEHIVTRVPIDYNIEVTEGENYLQILFLFPLQDANITVTDCNGNVIIETHQENSQEGKVLYIYTPQAYPYVLELTSLLVDIKGEIISEE